MSRLPDPYWLISLLGFICITPALKALNYTKIHSEEFQTIERNKWSIKYVMTIVLGAVFWMFVLFGLHLEMTEPQA